MYEYTDSTDTCTGTRYSYFGSERTCTSAIRPPHHTRVIPVEPLGTLTDRITSGAPLALAHLSIALLPRCLCSTIAHGSGLLCGLDHFMDSIDVGHVAAPLASRIIREALRVVDDVKRKEVQYSVVLQKCLWNIYIYIQYTCTVRFKNRLIVL